MSVEATGWAFRQKVPAKPKMLLLALADQTDEVTGHVCYGKRDAKHLAAKASCSERSFYRYLAALVRNGYALSQSGKTKGAANEYYLCLDRSPAKTLKEWHWNDEDGSSGEGADADDDADDQAQDVVEGSAKMADPIEPENGDGGAQIGRGGLPQGGRQESIDNQNIYEPKRSPKKESSFSRKAQDAEIENASISRAAERAGAKQFVIEGTRAWNDWIEWRRKRGLPATLPTCSHMIAPGQVRRGWWMPSLFPPSPSTGPPDSRAS